MIPARYTAKAKLVGALIAHAQRAAVRFTAGGVGFGQKLLLRGDQGDHTGGTHFLHSGLTFFGVDACLLEREEIGRVQWLAICGENISVMPLSAEKI